MRAPALKLEPEGSVEERLARLESDVQHIQSDVSDIKGHLLRVDNKIDALAKSTSEANAALAKSTSEANAALTKSTSEANASLERSISKLEIALLKSTSELKIWWLATLAASILGIVGRVFKWI